MIRPDDVTQADQMLPDSTLLSAIMCIFNSFVRQKLEQRTSSAQPTSSVEQTASFAHIFSKI
jgi:hypothetical protein